MARRILAALVVVGVALMLSPARLSGEPTTTSRAATATTTTPTTQRPNPQEVYPRRPGAKYDDIEAPPNGSITLVDALTIASAALEPRSALAKVWRPANPKADTLRGLVDAYTPEATETSSAVLHVVVHETQVLFEVPLVCDATTVNGGTALVPYDRDPPEPKPSSTAPPKFGQRDVDLYFPIGERRGRVYLTCQQVLFGNLTGGTPTHAVWAIDV